MSLFLVDGHALAYRSYYAFIKRPLINSKGEETSAVFGFVKTILNLLEKFDPQHLAVVFDSPEKTFRHEIFAAYKANREEMPETLIPQIQRIMELLDAMSIPAFSLAGYEADDIIATLSSEMEKAVPIRIVSGDKDLFQLITDKTHVIRPAKGGILEEEIDAAKLQEKTGLKPEQFVDFLALTGDASDNVPGVRGVGEKTALKLIKEFHSLDELYGNIDSVPSPSLRAKLLEDKDNAFLSRKLVLLDRRVPISAAVDDLARRNFQTDKLASLLEELEFMRILEGLEQRVSKEQMQVESGYRLVDSEKALAKLSEELSRTDEFAVDVEASDLDPMRAVLAGISLAHEPGTAWYVPVKSQIGESGLALTPPRESPGLPLDVVIRHLSGPFGKKEIKKIGQNIKYDAIVLTNAGIPLEGIDFDTMLASYCLNPARKSHSLNSLAAEFLGHKMIPFGDLFESRSKKKDIRDVPLERVKDYSCEDADMTLRLKKTFAALLESSQVQKLFRAVEMPLSRILTDMELEGVKLDVKFMNKLAEEMAKELIRIRSAVFEEAGEEFNLNSTRKLREILFRKLGLKPKRKTKTGYSTDMDVLKALSSEHHLPRLLLEYRTLSKLKNTYVDALPKLINPSTGRIHTSYNQAVTSTGRLSSSNPNLQNIPIRTPLGREIRKAFVPSGDGWVLLDADYSQVELRILAHLSRDAELIRAFEEGDDVHCLTASMILGVTPDAVSEEMRARAKTVNFGIIYGMGPRGLAQALEIEFQEAKKFIERYFECYPGVKRFVEATMEKAHREKAVSTLLGRIRQLPDIDSSDSRTRSFAERVAVNTPVQGTAADIIKVAMVKIAGEFGAQKLKAKMILQVHDELLFDLPESELEAVRAIVKETMENAIKLDVPLKVDTGVGINWLEAHR